MDSLTPNAPHCPNCGRPMTLARTTPRVGGLPELQTFECRVCRVMLTVAVENGFEKPAATR
jgi:transposase-like protein